MFNIVVGLFTAGILIVLYISNLLAVNTLAREIGQLQAYHDKVLQANAALQAEVDRKASLERIEAIAQESLGLEIPRETPVWFLMDENALDRAREAERLRERASGAPRP
jgi:cell division protein FtsL